MKFAEYNEEVGKNEFASSFENTSAQMSALQSLLIGEELQQEDMPLLKEFKCVQEFLDLPLNDKKEVVLKKVFAASIQIAKEKGVLPFNLPANDPISIASLVDEGLTRLKVYYQTANGTLDPIEAADALIDRVSVRAITVADKVIDRGVPVVLDKLCFAMVKVYPPAIAIVPIIKQAERYINVAAKQLVRKGVHVLANTAKTVVRKVAATVTKVASRIKNFLKA